MPAIDTRAARPPASVVRATRRAWFKGQGLALTIHLRRRWFLWVPVLAIWGLAFVRVLVDPTPRVPLLFNWTGSLPYRVAWLQRGLRPLQRGDLVVFAFDGEACRSYPGLKRQPFFKIVRGLPGDRITVEGRTVAINGVVVGTAKTRAFDRRPLEPIEATEIPPDHYYMQGQGEDSFDSRYRIVGLVSGRQVLGLVTPIF